MAQAFPSQKPRAGIDDSAGRHHGLAKAGSNFFQAKSKIDRVSGQGNFATGNTHELDGAVMNNDPEWQARALLQVHQQSQAADDILSRRSLGTP